MTVIPLSVSTRLPAPRAGRWVQPIELDPKWALLGRYLVGLARRGWAARPSARVVRPALVAFASIVLAVSAPWWASLTVAVIAAPLGGLGMLGAVAVATGRSGEPARHRAGRLGPVAAARAYSHAGRHRRG